MITADIQSFCSFSAAISRAEWHDWHWQCANRIRSVAQLVKLFPSLEAGKTAVMQHRLFPLLIPPYYASLIQQAAFSDPVFRISVPQAAEYDNPPFLSTDPLGESDAMPVPGVIRRYQDRIVLLASSVCAAHCRYCTRKWTAHKNISWNVRTILPGVIAYLKDHPEIKEVLISGGDPLMLETDQLEWIIRSLRAVDYVDIIRIGTRMPVVLPMRIDQQLLAMLKNYHPVWINTHFNHPVEVTALAGQACEALADAGCPVGNQTVLLRGVNDSAETIETLCRALVKHRVRPYYLFQCDLVPGVEPFRTPLSLGLAIIAHMRARVTGIAVPTFVVDMPGQGGKIALEPNHIIEQTDLQTVFKTHDGHTVLYPEPQPR